MACCAHQQYELEPAYFKRLWDWSAGEIDAFSDIDMALCEAGFLVEDGSVAKVSLPSATAHTSDWHWDSLSYFFHQGTRNIGIGDDSATTDEAWSTSYLDYCQALPSSPALLTRYEGDGLILPSPDLDALHKKSFWAVVMQRMTCRNFYGQSLSLQHLSTLLFAGFGPVHGAEWAEFKCRFRNHRYS